MANAALETFPVVFRRHWLSGMRAKLGLFNEEAEDGDLVDDLLSSMQWHAADFTNTFRDLAGDDLPDATFFRAPDFQLWYSRWQDRLDRQPESREESSKRMRAHNPAVIPRNHRVEEALAAAVEQADLTVMERLLDVLSAPYADLPKGSKYHLPAPPSDTPYQTFCGT
jgi:uncharacterized protein YdiU (UPF0061 family)